MIRRPPRSTLFPTRRSSDLVADAKGLGGHTGGPYDIVPEVMIADGLAHGSGGILPIWFDEAGHRVAIQDRKSTLLNSSHGYISYAVFCLKKKINATRRQRLA